MPSPRTIVLLPLCTLARFSWSCEPCSTRLNNASRCAFLPDYCYKACLLQRSLDYLLKWSLLRIIVFLEELTTLIVPGLLHPHVWKSGIFWSFSSAGIPGFPGRWWKTAYLQSAGTVRRKYTWDNIEQTCLDSFFSLFLYAQVIQGEKGILYSIGHRWQSRCYLSPQGRSSSLTRNKIWRAQLLLEWIPLEELMRKRKIMSDDTSRAMQS